ncbi:ATP-binding cassette domain-containing protein [Marinitoga aeolica]|uniref:ABC transporter ATP-binding protein n=1 Tax=Marinitoga aeolica TaxID=2809031 RepID=A0ABY8PP25_9BACT|nr:ABC transporter ATP-binding protein [Marinitoga aeolica]WGS64344.1 ABC transporter ATP-binding protein [Marinitoga aeolica]
MWKLLKNVGYKNLIIFFLAIIFGILSMIFQIGIPLQIKKIIDYTINNKDVKIQMIISLFLIYIASEITELISGILSTYTEASSEKELRKKLLKNIINNKSEKISEKGIGYIQTLIFDDIEIFLSIMNPRIVITSLYTLYILISGYIMFKINILYTAIIVFYLVSIFFHFKIAFKKNSEGFQKVQNTKRDLKAKVENLLKTRVDLYLYNKIKYFFEKQNKEFDEFTEKNKKAYSINHIYINMIPEYIRTISFSMILIISIYQLISKTITIGTFQMILNYSGTIFIVAQQLSIITSDISRALSNKNILLEYIENNKKNLSKISEEEINNILVENLSYGYNGTNLIENLSFSAYKNEIIIIKGKSGTGKTTLLDILSGRKEIGKGKIKINNDNNLEVKNIINKISYMTQNDYIFNESVYENISLGRNINKEIIREMLDFFSLKDIHLDYKLEKNGNNISGGQKSRILLARALTAKERKIILLDEPLNGVDKKTKQKILYGINKFLKDKIVIISTHDKDISKIGKIIDIEQFSSF